MGPEPARVDDYIARIESEIARGKTGGAYQRAWKRSVRGAADPAASSADPAASSASADFLLEDALTPPRKGGAQRNFAIISGDVPIEDRARIQDLFNAETNIHGGEIDLILLSSTGAEGLDLHNIRHIHVMEPYWNMGRVLQIIGRGVRNDSHISLPSDEKTVQPYIYLAVPPETERRAGIYPPTTDTELYEESIKNQLVIDSFGQALREVSIECLANDESYCRSCNPTGQPLYTDDPARDVRAPDPCIKMQRATVRAEEIIVDGKKYYFVADPASLYEYKIFVLDKSTNVHKVLKESDPMYLTIINAITARAD
jgi:hypothetical protein